MAPAHALAPRPARRPGAARDLRVLLCLAAAAAGMGGLAYASVPLYRLFCQVTGYGGTTQTAEAPSDGIVDRPVTVRFDATVNPALDWSFAPVERAIELRAGENALAFYAAENLGDAPSVGTATFNVTPDRAGVYFNKVECFCFQEQRLEPGQRVEMPVSFFVDPAIADDPHMADVTTVTLAYTFFRAAEPDTPARADE